MASPKAPVLYGGIVVEVNKAKRYIVDHDGVLHFRVRNFTPLRGTLWMLVGVENAEVQPNERKIRLAPQGTGNLLFPIRATVPGEKAVVLLQVRFDFDQEGLRRRLVLPDMPLTVKFAATGEGGTLATQRVELEIDDMMGDLDAAEVIGDAFENAEIKLKIKRVTGDAKLSKLLRAPKPRPDEDWVPLALIPQCDGEIVSVPPAGTEGIQDLVLQETTLDAKTRRRFFLFARRELKFGLKAIANSKMDGEGEVRVPLVTRVLPCASEAQHGKEYRLNNLISRLHGRLQLDGAGVSVRDEKSLNGTQLDGAALPPAKWMPLPEQFTLRLTDSTPCLSLSGRLFWPEAGQDNCGLVLGYPFGRNPGDSLEVGAERCLPVDALRLRRNGNTEEHTYFQVFRQATVGKRDTALLIQEEGVETRHAAIVYYRSEWFVTSLSETAVTTVNGQQVRPGEYRAIFDSANVTFGKVKFQVQTTQPRHMCAL